MQRYRWSWMDRPLSFGFPSVRLAVRSLWFSNSSGQTLAREPPCTPRLLVQQPRDRCHITSCFNSTTPQHQNGHNKAGKWYHEGRAQSAGGSRKLLISPTGGCRPRGLRYVAGMLAGPYNSVYLPASGYGPVSPRRWNSSKALIFVILNTLRFASSNPHQLKVTSQAGIDRSTFHSLARGVSHIDRVCAATQQRHSNDTSYLPHRVSRSSEVTTKPAVVDLDRPVAWLGCRRLTRAAAGRGALTRPGSLADGFRQRHYRKQSGARCSR